jgi:glucosyl-dolichyl phosphate glucuronosyltransferase
MDVSIILCTANRSKSLQYTLAALGEVTVPKGMNPTLLVIDNAPAQETKNAVSNADLRNMQVEYVAEPRTGKCVALNAGIEKARGEIILFLDDDVRPPTDWLEGLCRPILSGKADAVVGGVRIAPHLQRPWMSNLQKSLLASTEFQSREDPHLIGASSCIARKVLDKVPAYDTEIGPGALGLYDDTLFSYQVKEAGFRITTAFETVAEHHFDEDRLSRSSWLDHAKRKGRSLAYLRYHWAHKDVESPRRKIVEAYASLAKWRLKRNSIPPKHEGIEDWELTVVSHIHLYKQFLKERNVPRKYGKFGLTKLHS